ncbi:MAG: Uncharacterised protein [Cryomorphaceae bacterium]|nr:MAG: Uncharacterised protein [Cryomorphaceae bacterium]
MKDLVLNQVTMTSLELVEFINSQREDSASELRHADFLEKVVKVLGLEMSDNFRSSYIDSMNRQKPCYRFPKREACLMAMSYSYDLQAKVFDRMTALEQQQKSQSTLLDTARNTFDNALHFAKLFGLEGNQALLSADKATARHTGFSPMKFLQIELKNENQTLNLTPTEIGKQLNPRLSAIGTNKRLESLGYQEKLGSAWVPTTAGKPYAVFLDTGKKHSDGTPVTQLKWLSSIIEHIA